jgi:L-ascorbate metabolism protein UlaG (beta-lactamase superfamily)
LDITWYGLSCFRITERNKTTVMTDPYAPTFGIMPGGTTRTDVVTVSHEAAGHSDLSLIKGEPYVLRTPGEYEIGGTFITGVPLHHVSDTGQLYNVGYLVDYGGLTVLHVGDLAYLPEQSVVENLGEVTVLLLPVGGGQAMTASLAAELVALIEPSYIVPMHYALPGLSLELDDAEKFLKAMGVGTVQEEAVLKVAGGSLPEQPEVVLLKPTLE